jgi:hypothetical protein
MRNVVLLLCVGVAALYAAPPAKSRDCPGNIVRRSPGLSRSSHPGSFNPEDIVRQCRPRTPDDGRRTTASIGFPDHGRRTTGDGLDDGEFLIDTSITYVGAPRAQAYPAIAFDGTNFLVTWEDCRGGPYSDIYAARVTPQGTVLDTSGIPVSTATSRQGYPAIAFDGASFLVAWEDSRNGMYSDIYAARVTPQGTVLDPSGIPVSTAAYGQYVPAIAFDGANFLVTWQGSGSSPDIYAARVTPQGTVLDPTGIPVSTATYDQLYPAVAFDGANFLVAWQDNRSGSYSDIYAARVTPSGVVFDTGPAVRQDSNQSCPALARGPANQMFLVYQGWAGTVGGKTYNTDRIWGKFGPFPGVEETPNGEVCTTSSLPTIVRGVLFLPRPLTPDSRSPTALFDIGGRKVIELHPGANDVSRLSPGVYFVRTGSTARTHRVVVLK